MCKTADLCLAKLSPLKATLTSIALDQRFDDVPPSMLAEFKCVMKKVADAIDKITEAKAQNKLSLMPYDKPTETGPLVAEALFRLNAFIYEIKTFR